MQWHDVCFAHWRTTEAPLARRLPAGVELDTYDGSAWLSVVPFRMSGVRLRRAPTVPGFHDVAEINLRTYVRVGGVAGIWFFSLDASQPIVVASARLMTGLPYFNARIATSESSAGIQYHSTRTDRRNVGGTFEARYRTRGDGRVAEPGSLEAFLHERYHFFTLRAARLVDGEISHLPWRLHDLDITIERNSLGDIAGAPLSGRPDAAYFARELHVRAAMVRSVPRDALRFASSAKDCA